MKDRETGLEIGAYVSSAGLTNQPFLDGMRPLAARRDGGQARAGDGGATPSAVMLAKPFLTQTLRAPSDYMPVIRACLGLTELSTHDEVCAQMTRLSERCALADATGKHEGVDLRSTYLNGLAECAGVSGGATMQDILDTVQDMIDVAIDQHVDSYHEGGSANLSAKQPSDTTTTTTITPEEEHMEPKPADLTAKITSLESEVTTLSGHVSTKDKELVTLRTTHEVLTKAHEEAMTLCKAAGIKAEGTVVDLVKNLLETNAVLLKAKTDRDEADILADVALVIEQYGPAGLKHFGEDRKPALLKHRRESPESFKDSYPIMTREQLTDAVRLLTNSPQGNPPKRAMPTPKSDKVVLSHAALTAKLMTEKSLSYRDAQDEASRQLKAMEDGAVHGAAK
jgi:hypothetical protein